MPRTNAGLNEDGREAAAVRTEADDAMMVATGAGADDDLAGGVGGRFEG